MNFKQSYLGFTNELSPMQKAKVEQSMDKLFRYDGKVMSRKEFVYSSLQNGYLPELEENYSYYSRKLDDMTKPKTRYKLVNDNLNLFYEVTKTEYQFAKYLLNNDFLDEQKANNYILQEQQQKENEEKERQLKEQQERDERQKQSEIQKEKDRQERQEKIRLWNEKGLKLMNDQIVTIITESVEKHWNAVIKAYPTIKKDELIQKVITTLPQYLGNIEYLKSNVQYYIFDDINQNNLNNKIYKDIYIPLFHITENDSKHTVTAKVKAFCEGREYKGSGTSNNNEHVFYVYNVQEKTFIEEIGQKVNIEGYTCYIQEKDKNYNVVEGKSGANIVSKQPSKKVAIEKAKEMVNKFSAKMDQLIENSIRKTGLSPLYQEEKAV